MSLNEKSVALSVAPETVKGVTYIPIKVIGDLTGAAVKWDATTRIVTIVEKPNSLLERLTDRGDLEGVQKVLQENPDMDLNRDQGVYLLNAVLSGDNFEVVKALVNAGANINVHTVTNYERLYDLEYKRIRASVRYAIQISMDSYQR